MNNTYIIVADWGTTHLRAYLCQVNNDFSLSHLKTLTGRGVSKVSNKFEQELFHCIKPWITEFGKLPILLSGQIGSSIGWRETSYLACPINPDEIAKSCMEFTVQQQSISIVPGLSCAHDNDHHDVMRGEELQVLGWLSQHPNHRKGSHLVCLPGTHTKWVLVRDGNIELFKTAMTGELYALLCDHSILIQKQNSQFNLNAFEQGAKYTLESKLGSFTHGLFSVRTKQLFNELSADHAASYLSGILIGTDVRAAMNATEWHLDELESVIIIGNDRLSMQFAQVLKLLNINSEIINVEQATISGYSHLYQADKHRSNTN